MENNLLIKQLASHHQETREKALVSLRNYLTTKNFQNGKQSQFDKLWKGLYFSMWHCDKPIPQQRLAQGLGELHLLYLKGKKDQAFLRFSKAFWKVICLEWYQIDHHRIDKFLLLIRRCLHYQLKYLYQRDWAPTVVTDYIEKVLRKIPLSGDRKVYNGIPFHIIDILVDEWVKVCLEDEEAGSEADEEDEEETKQRTKEAVDNTPLLQFIEIFRDLRSNTSNIKMLREKIKQDIEGDERLQSWGLLSANVDVDSTDELEDDEEEWKGF